MNGYAATRPVAGWDGWFVYSHPRGMGWQETTNGARQSPTTPAKGERMVGEKALSWLGEEREAPFLAVAAFGAPHASYPYGERERGTFSSARAPRTAGFNEKDVSDKPAWVRKRPRLGEEGTAEVDRRYRAALRSLANVDRFVGKAAAMVPENTIVIYWTDNGTHTGYHRLPYGKNTPYEEDVNFPLIVRGPGVEPGTSEKLVGNHDLAPTIADLAGVEAPGVDGRSIAPLFGAEEPPWRDALLVEKYHRSDDGTPPWRAVRTEGETYVEYAGGGRELYDLRADPHQVENRLHEPTPDAEARASELSVRLDALRDCAGDSCRAAEAAPPQNE